MEYQKSSGKNQSAVSLDEFKLHRLRCSRLIEWEKTFPVFCFIDFDNFSSNYRYTRMAKKLHL